MKWIKASERLPEKKGWYIIRIIGSETNYCDNMLFDPEIDTKARLTVGTNESEWLCEDESHNEAVEFGEWLLRWCVMPEEPEFKNKWVHEGDTYTTTELYNIFKQAKN